MRLPGVRILRGRNARVAVITSKVRDAAAKLDAVVPTTAQPTAATSA